MKEKIIHSLLDVSRDKILKRSFFWNMIASMLNAITSAILLFFITRFCGINEAGVFSIASAIAYQCVSLGNFGTRGVQASDVKEEFSIFDPNFLEEISKMKWKPMWNLAFWPGGEKAGIQERGGRISSAFLSTEKSQRA